MARDSRGRFIKGSGGNGVTDRDLGYRDLFKRVDAITRDPHFVTLGVQGDQAEKIHGDDKEGISNLRLAGVHEFGATIQTANGTINIPERSFLRSTFDKNHTRYLAAVRKLSDLVLIGKLEIKQALGIFGERATSDVKKTIEDGIDPENAESTIARKGSSLPLVDTGELKNTAITYMVRREGEEG